MSTDGFTLTGKELENILWNASLMQDVHEHLGDSRGLFCWLEDDRVSGHECSDRHSTGNGQGEVPWTDHDGNAAWFMEFQIKFTDELTQPPRFKESNGLSGVVLAEIDCFADISICFTPDFS